MSKDHLISCASSLFTYLHTYVCILTLNRQTILSNWDIDKQWQHLPQYWNHVSALSALLKRWDSQNSPEQSCYPVLVHSITVLRIRSTWNIKWSSPPPLGSTTNRFVPKLALLARFAVIFCKFLSCVKCKDTQKFCKCKHHSALKQYKQFFLTMWWRIFNFFKFTFDATIAYSFQILGRATESILTNVPDLVWTFLISWNRHFRF